MIPKYWYYLIQVILFGLITLTVIPKEKYKLLFFYSLIFGAIFDIARIVFLDLLGLIKYFNLGPFNILGMFSFFEPIAWIFVFMIFFYFLPKRKIFFYPYIVVAAQIAYLFGFVQQGLDLFRFIGIQIYLAPFLLILVFYLSAWVYIKYEHIELC